NSPNQLAIPFYNILWAEVTTNASSSAITIDYALPTSAKHVRPEKLTYPLGDVPVPDATKWTEVLLAKAYGNSQRRKRAKAIVNPHAGPGGADKIWDREVRPLFEAARMPLDVSRTTYTGEAITICEQLDISQFDVVIPCSGDGLPYEVFNGLGKRPDARKALSDLAVAHIPCGSGNGMTCNLYGSPPSPSLAALGIVKGVRGKMDLMSVTQGDRRMLSFLSQSLGIIAESDLGTENMRWMGATRFDVGVVQRIFSKKVYPCEVAVKVEIADKHAIKAHYKRVRTQEEATLAALANGEDVGGGSEKHVLEEQWEGEGLPPLKYGTINDKVPEDWEQTTYEKMGNFYNGNMAWMAPAANFFPAACINDGLMDLVYNDGDLSASKYITLMTAVESGKFFDNPHMTYRKISAYRITPRAQTHGYISIDGEKVPFEPFQVEIHPGLATVLSKTGRYEAPGPNGWEQA
ncbi:diacylglycerol kinase catalytic domain-containing protein, partial [Microdochium trichocladiopsis]